MSKLKLWAKSLLDKWTNYLIYRIDSYEDMREAAAEKTVRDYVIALMCLMPFHGYLAYSHIGQDSNLTIGGWSDSMANAQFDMLLMTVLLASACAFSAKTTKFMQATAFAVSAIYAFAALAFSYTDLITKEPNGLTIYIVLAAIAVLYKAPPYFTGPLYAAVHSVMLLSVYFGASHLAEYKYGQGSLIAMLLAGPVALTLSVSHWHIFVVRTSLQQRLTKMLKIINQQQLDLNRLSDTDDLTGLKNRKSFWKITSRDYAKSARLESVEGSSLVLMDLDGLSVVNEKYGVDIGDKVIKKVSRIIRSSVRVTDVASRLGSDEFAVFFPETDINGALTVCEAIRSLVEEHNMVFPAKDGQPLVELKITVSSGIAIGKGPCGPRDGITLDSLYESADRALYRAKKCGKNNVKIAGVLFDVEP